MVHPQMRWNQSLPFLKHIENKFDLGSVLRGPQFTMPNANAWPGMRPQIKAAGCPAVSPQVLRRCGENRNNPNLTGFPVSHPSRRITPQQKNACRKNKQENNKTLKIWKPKKSPEKNLTLFAMKGKSVSPFKNKSGATLKQKIALFSTFKACPTSTERSPRNRQIRRSTRVSSWGWRTWMSQEVNKCLVKGLQPTYKWGILMYIGDITHLLTIY